MANIIELMTLQKERKANLKLQHSELHKYNTVILKKLIKLIKSMLNLLVKS